MKNRTAIKIATFIVLLTAAFALTSRTVVAQTKIQGVIDGRSGPTMSLKTVNSPPDTTVLLTDGTDVGEVEGVFHGRTKQMPMTALIPGLPVQVSGSLNGQNQLVADSVKFKGSDLKAAMDAQAGLQPTEQKVAANPSDPAAVRELNQAEGQLGGTLGRLFALSEAYPDLKANQNMLALQEELTATENKIAFARQAFNDAGASYNIRREVFPANTVADVFGFKEAALLETAEAERAAPEVSFQ